MKTLYQQIDSLFDFSENPVKRVGTGFKVIDDMIRGPAPGEVCMILGRSFSGKSILAQNIINHNKELPSIFFSLEMPYMQAIIRMYSMWSDTPSGTNQLQLDEGKVSPDMWNMVLDFPLHVIDDRGGQSLEDMSRHLEEFEAELKVRPEFVVIDYLELVAGAKASGEGFAAVEAQSTMLKDWAKEESMRVFLLHQTNRNEKRWQPPNEDSARFGGFTEADFVIGMWRPHTDPELDYWDAMSIKHHLNLNLIKDRVFFKERDKIEMMITPTLRIIDGTSN
jgi:replicative DNA helicase